MTKPRVMHSKCAHDCVSGFVFSELSEAFLNHFEYLGQAKLAQSHYCQKGKTANGSIVLGACECFGINHRLSGVLK